MKSRFGYGVFSGLLVLAALTASAQAPNDGLDGAKWIWHPPTAGESPNAFDASVRFFRTELSLPESPALRSAEIIITCDNLFVLYLNGRPVGESETDISAWNRPKRYDLSALLSPGRVVLAVEAVNTFPGPSGLLVRFVAELQDGRQIISVSDGGWKSADAEIPNWEQPSFDDQKWVKAEVISEYGAGPWGRLVLPASTEPGGAETGKVAVAAAKIATTVSAKKVERRAPAEDFSWPGAVVFVGGDCSLYRPNANTGNSPADSLSVTIFNPRKARTFPEHDLPAPMKVGHRLMLLKPARPDVQPQTLLDAGAGALGSPGVSFDGNWVYFSMAREGDAFFHLYRIAAEGGTPQQLTDGPFFDIDPAELPDGRIVFTSTRMGTFEEYHNPPSRALYAMNPDGSAIHPLTNTIIFDNEPEVLADGRILFIRSDNFFDRGKVETLLHAVFPDGTRGQTEFGLDQGPEYGGRLRAFNCGSPAPMPDGQVAYVSSAGITVGRMGHSQESMRNFGLEAGDVAALPDGRLLCTVARPVNVEVLEAGQKKTVREPSYQEICILDPQSVPPVLTTVHDSAGAPLHSPVYVGARPRPPQLHAQADLQPDSPQKPTGMIFCQNARNTKNSTAGWGHVRAIRVLAGTGLTNRSSHSYIVHAGNETVELGTVPLAPDGSFFVEVPADTPIALQAVDAEGRSELNEMSWMYVRPGERRTCVGCHQPRQSAPVARTPRALALLAPPVSLLGAGRPHHFRGNNPAVTGLMELQFDRFREVAGINRHSGTSSPAATGRDDVNALIAQLQSGDTGLKTSAAQVLALFRDPSAAPALAEALGDPSRETRLAAAVALAACGTRTSVPPLLKTLSDNDPVVAQGAAMALENLTGHSEQFNPFVEEGKPRDGAEAWRAWFAGISWESIGGELTRQVESENPDWVRRAAVALGHTGDATARTALRNHVSNEQGKNPYPAWRKDGHESDGASFNALSPVNPRSLQAATRALGQVGDTTDVPMLSELLVTHGVPATGNLFLAEAVAEALGRIGTPEAENALIQAFAGLKDYPDYTYWYGDHPALMACHASPIHYFIIEALDRMGSTRADAMLAQLIRSVPIDPDRALLLPNDDYETLVGRVLRRQAGGKTVVETCLAMLGDGSAQPLPEIKEAVSTTIRCWGGHPGPEIRAAQILSLACRDQAAAPRVEAALLRYAAMDSGIKRVFNTGIPVVDALPLENWVSFYLARTLGNLAHPKSADTLIALLDGSPTEAAAGRPDPLGPGVLFLHNGLTPCWRSAVAWALGNIGAPQAVPVLLKIVRDLNNAPDTRHAAAVALGQLADEGTRETLRDLAAQYPERSTRLALLEALRQKGQGSPIAANE